MGRPGIFAEESKELASMGEERRVSRAYFGNNTGDWVAYPGRNPAGLYEITAAGEPRPHTVALLMERETTEKIDRIVLEIELGRGAEEIEEIIIKK